MGILARLHNDLPAILAADETVLLPGLISRPRFLGGPRNDNMSSFRCPSWLGFLIAAHHGLNSPGF